MRIIKSVRGESMATDKITYNVRGIIALANGSRELATAKTRIQELLRDLGESERQKLRAQLGRELTRHQGAARQFIAEVLEWLDHGSGGESEALA
jgi:hypothetical protein